MNILYHDGAKLKQRPGTLWVPAFFSSSKPEQVVFHTTARVADRFASFFEEEFLTQFLVKQELKKLYNDTYFKFLNQQPTTSFQTEDKHIAQLKALQECFIATQHFATGLFDFSQFQEQKNAVTALNVRYQMLENPEFLENVLHAIEVVPNHAPVSVAESVAQVLKEVFVFDQATQAAHFYASEKAEQAVMQLYHSNSALQAKIEQTKNACKNVLVAPVQASVAITGYLKETLPQIVLHLFAIENNDQQNIEPNLYDRAMKRGTDMVFRDHWTGQTVRPVQPLPAINLPLVLKEYQNEIGLLLSNKVSLAKLRHDMVDIENFPQELGVEIDLKGKQAERLFYHISNEIFFESIALKERDKAIKRAIGNATSDLLERNEKQLDAGRIASALAVLPELLPNCSPAYLEVVKKENSEVTYDEFLKNLKMSIAYNRGALRIGEKVDEFNFAEKTVQALSLQLQEQELNGIVYFADYESHIAGIKQEMNALRLAEYAKIAQEYGSIQTVFDYEVQFLKALDENLISQQEKKTILYHDVLNQYVSQLGEKLDTIASLYNGDRSHLEGFSVSFVKGVAEQLAWEPNPKIRLSAITAYANVLEKNNVIQSHQELQNIIEVLCKRQNPLYEKIQVELNQYADVFHWARMQDMPVLTPSVVQKAPQTLKQKAKTYAENGAQQLDKAPILDKKAVEKAEKLEEKTKEKVTERPLEEASQGQENLSPLPKPLPAQENAKKKSITDQFDQMKAVNIGLIDQDALSYVQLERYKQQLDEFEKLTSKEQKELLSRLQKTMPIEQPADNSQRQQAGKYLQVLEEQNQSMLKKYGKCSDDEKIAFVVLALNKQEEMPQAQNDQETTTAQTAKIYHLDDKKEFVSCKNDLFWKMQLLAVKNNIDVERTLNDETLTEFKQIAPVVKLFEIAASDHMGLSDVKIANIGQLNYQQLARVSILKFKDGKINDPATVNLINHILTNTSAYSKTQEYAQTVEALLRRPDIEQGLQSGTMSLDQIIENESQEQGALESILSNFYKKTTPNLPKLVKSEENDVGNDNITI